jgi:hypothetical protein
MYNSAADIGSMSLMSATDAVQGRAGFNAKLAGLVEHDIITQGMGAAEAAEYRAGMAKLVDSIRSGKAKHIPRNAEDRAIMERAALYAEQANEAALEGLHQRTLKGFGGQVQRILDSDNVIMKPIRTFILPFVKTPLNLVNFAMERTVGAAQFNPKVAAAIRGELGDRAMVEAQAKLVSGSILYTLGGMLAMNGQLVGAHRKEERQAMKAAGIPEYAIRIGDTWYSYTRSFPLGSFLGYTADFYKASQYAQDEDTAAAAAHFIYGFGQLTASKTFLKGVGDLINLTQNPERAEHMLGNIGQMLVPMSSQQRFVSRMVDPRFKESFSNMDKALQGMYVNQRSAKVKIDPFGKEIEADFFGAVLGIRTWDANDVNFDASNEMRLHGVMPSTRDWRFDGVKMSKEESYEARRLMYEKFDPMRRVSALINSDSYARANMETRGKMLRSLVGDMRDSAKRAFATRDIEFRTKYLDAKAKQLEFAASNPEVTRGHNTGSERKISRTRKIREIITQ